MSRSVFRTAILVVPLLVCLLTIAGAVVGCSSGSDESKVQVSDSSWVVTSLGDGQGGTVPILEDTKISLTFDPGGEFAGNAGCNSYWGSYTLSGEAMSIEGLDVTDLECAEPQGVMEQEASYLKLLQSAVTTRLSGETLELRAEDGALLASFEPYEVPESG